MVVSLPSEMLLAEGAHEAEIWQIPKSNGGMVVGLPSEELLGHYPKKKLWQNCRRTLCSQNHESGGKGNATKVVLTVEHNN